MKPFPLRGSAIAITIAVFLGETTTPDAFLLPSPSASACATAVADAASSSQNFYTREKHHRIKTLSTLRGGGSRSGGVNARRVKSLRNAASSDDMNDDSSKDGSNEQSIPTAALNLIKGCVGSGVLSLPAGVAALGDVPKAILPASAIVLTLGAISAYTFHLLGRLTYVTIDENGKKESKQTSTINSIGDLWEYEVGKSSSWLVSASIFLTCFMTCLAYSIILGDTFSSLAETAGLTGLMSSRRTSILLITLTAVYPLSCLKSLAALAPVSLMGNIGILMTCIVMTIRALPGGAYSPTAAIGATNFLRSLPAELQPSFGVTGFRSPRSLLILSSMTACAYLVHMVGPEFYQTMKDPSVVRFGILSAVSFGGTALISAFMMCVGFLTFGGACKGMILNNYSTLDKGATLCRLLMGISLLGSYAFLSKGMRSAFYEIFYKGKEITDKIHYRTMQILIGILTTLALFLGDAGFVVSVTGAVLGSSLIYIIPPYLFLKSTKRRTTDGSLTTTSTLKFERLWNKFLICLGVFFAVAGAGMSVANTFFPHLL
mmetsp:Transcript_3235/g.6914  ORF Transcript_3235/g.6914 Transcript_3235/m.6914 type:complete len:546 (+) Transcript_3235:94-1731(+)